MKPPAPSIAALERAARLNKLRKKANFHSMRTRRDPAGAEAPIFNSFFGTTEVVPCYKARPGRSIASGRCDRGLSHKSTAGFGGVSRASRRPYGTAVDFLGRVPRISSGAILMASLREAAIAIFARWLARLKSCPFAQVVAFKAAKKRPQVLRLPVRFAQGRSG